MTQVPVFNGTYNSTYNFTSLVNVTTETSRIDYTIKVKWEAYHKDLWNGPNLDYVVYWKQVIDGNLTINEYDKIT